MSKNLERTRWLVELQGFHGVADENLDTVDLGLRVAPVVCASIATAGTVSASATVFWGLLAFALAGAMLPGHPFDVLYNHGIRHLLKGPRLPRYPFPRRFACMFASVLIVAAALCLESGAVLAGQILGAAMVVGALVPVMTGLCIPSFLLHAVTGLFQARRAALSH